MDKQYFLDKLLRTRPSVFKTYNYDLLPIEFKAHGFKRYFRYWFVVNGKLRVFKKSTDVYREFCIPGNVEVKNLVTEVRKLVNDLRVLF